MTTPILATKVYIPPLRPNVVRRPHLLERLNEGLDRKLTLISAPAGFGKTTLVSEWVEQLSRPAAWLSLDEGDNDPARFLTYLVAALQTIVPGIGAGILDALHSPQPPPLEAMMTTLLNALAALPGHVVLVLDDYHVVEAPAVDLALTYVLEHLPPHMHLAIATREDPQLPLSRLRARGELTELRAAELRFTPAEAAAFLGQMMGLTLSAEDIDTLGARTEGWIAGLQLAALSLRGHQNASAFIQAFAGDHRYIVDYLVDEVLERQGRAVRGFLLRTAILERMSGPLCDAVTGQKDGSARLVALERGNFFVVPLDDHRTWYRYHHLFADVLQARLLAEQPGQVAPLHRRASAWFEQQGMTAEAVRHALAAGDFAHAADLIELALPTMRQNRQDATMFGWLKALPDELVRLRPVLSVAYAWVLLAAGELDEVEARLRDAEQWLDTSSDVGDRGELHETRATRLAESAQMVVVNEEEFRRLPAAIALYRAVRAQARGEVTDAVRFARRTLELVPEDDHLVRGAAAAVLGLASWASGDLETAYRTYAEGMARVQRAGHLADAVGGAIALADIRIAQGRLREAMSIYERGVQLATQQDAPTLRGTADLYMGMSELYREWNDLDAATQHLARSQELSEQAGLPQHPYRWCIAMARIKEARGDFAGALDLLHEAERQYVGDVSPNVRPVAALVARVWVAQGRLDDALDWARERGLSADDELTYLREFEHITLARVLLACPQRHYADGALREAIDLLERLLDAAHAGKRTGSIIEILVLQALAHQAHGNMHAALVALQRALTLAEPEGYVRLYVDEGPPMAALLEAAKKHEIALSYVRQLLAALGAAEEGPPVTQTLIEPLSDRELQVLRLLATDLDGPEIARELVVSLNTLRTHTKNIYSKLGVNSRRAAVRRAEELALLSGIRTHQSRPNGGHRV